MTFLVSRPAALTSLALAMAAPIAAAQSTAGTVLVTATRTPQAVADVISDTLTIGPEQIARSGAGSIIDLLQRQRGFEVARNGGPGASASVFIRGANSNQNIVLIDGVRIGSSTTGAANWSAIPLTAIDHIEVVYGPLSSLYGADAIGGVVQIFTKKGDGAPALTAFAGYGSDNTREADATLTGATDDAHRIRYALSAGKEKSDGFSTTRSGNPSYNPDKDGYDRENLSGSIELALAKGHDVGALLMHSKLMSQYDSGVKSPYDTHSLQKLENAAIYSRNQILPFWSSMLQLSQARDEQGIFTSAVPSQLDTSQTDLTWQNDVQIGADVLQLLYNHRKESVESKASEALDKALNRDRITNAYALAYNAKRGANLFNASIRRDNSEYGNKNTGAAGYGYSFSHQLRASASVGTSFRAPTYNELYYPGYGAFTNKPELGRNTEIGLHYDDGASSLSASYYHNRLTDMIVSLTPCPTSSGLKPLPASCAYNVNHALLQGLTLAASRKMGNFTLLGTADLQDPKDETTGKRLARRAKKHANVSLDYGVGALKAGVELTLSGDRFDNATNTDRLGGYGLVNLYATYRINADWSALARWNNIADKQYDLARFYNTPGSKVFAGLRYGYK